MKVVKLLLSSSPTGFGIAAIIGALGGASASGLLHTMTQGLREPTPTLGILFAVFVAMQLALAITSQAVLTRLGARLLADLRIRIANAALDTAFPVIEKIGLPRIRTAIIEDAQTIGAVTGTLVSMIIAAVTLIGGFGYLAWMSPSAALSTIVLAVLAALLYRRLATRGLKGVMGAFKKRGRLYANFEGIIFGATEIRLHRARRQAVLADIEAPSTDFHTSMGQGVSFNYAAEAVGQTALLLGVAAAVMSLAAFGARSGGTSLVLAVVFMQAPLYTLLSAGPEIVQANAAANQLETLLGNLAKAPKVEQSDTADTKPTFESIDLAGVKFKYPESQDEFDLGPIDLAIRPGELLFLVGGNGSGKTTLAKVLIGLYSPEGKVTLDGKPVVTAADRDGYRNKFAVVFSDGFVFPELWGVSPSAIDAKANDLLAELKLGNKVELKDGKLSTTQLSTGQRKRLALLAAYLEERPIFLFDEWAADQDPTFKKLFYTKYLPELKRAGKTAIVISHDDRYFDVADRVIQLDRGRIVDASKDAVAS